MAMKCKHCGGEQFVGHQVVRMDILVDGEGDYIDAVHPDAPGLDIYDSEPAYGPFQCCGCGAEYDELAEGEDSIDGPVEGWTWGEDGSEAGVEMAPVVRCKDCIHYHEETCLKIYDDAHCYAGAIHHREPDDFCSYGKKMDLEV